MKTKVIFLLSCLVFAYATMANAQVSNDSLLLQINKINNKLSNIDEKVENKYYTRIPNEDFENLINVKVEEKVNNKFYFWIGLIIGFITLSGAGFYSLINSQIESKVKKASAEFTRYIDESMNKRFAEINNFILEAKKSIFNEELEKLQRRIVNNTSQNQVEYVKVQEKLAVLLKRAEEISDPELSTIIIDELVRCYYFNRNNKEISEIIQQYQSKYDLTATTLANAAISYTDLYELDGSLNYKEMALKYCQEAFKKNPVYGEPTAMELIIHMMDHLRLPNEIEKNKASNEALLMIQKVNSGSSYYWANQTIKRMDIDKSYIFAKYVDHLFEIFPDEMKEMKKRSEEFEAKKHL